MGDENDKTAATPLTEEQRFEAETEEFRSPGAGKADEPAEMKSDKPEGQGDDDKAKADDAAADDTSGDANADDDAKDGAKGGGDRHDDDATAKAKADDADPDAPKDGEIPKWMKDRLDRSKRRETDAERRAREAEEKARELEEENARLKAKAPAKEPDPDEFETVAEYEEAKAAWKAEKAKAAETEKPKPKPESNLPLGITREELSGAIGTLEDNLPDTVIARLKDPAQVPSFPAPVMLEIADEGDKAQQTAMARFVIGNQKIMGQISRLPARQQASAFMRAFKDSTPAERKTTSKAPPPIDPNTTGSGRDAKTSIPALSAMSYEEFERVQNEQDMRRGRSV